MPIENFISQENIFENIVGKIWPIFQLTHWNLKAVNALAHKIIEYPFKNR